MIRHDVEQRSEEWHALRLGIPTASRFGDVLTARGDLRTGEMPKKYAAELIAERVLGVPTQRQASSWMQRGSDLEPMARQAFAEKIGAAVEPVGFITTNDGRLGCSPDGIIRRANGSNVCEGVEIKSPAQHTHVYYLTYGLGEYYIQQVQGQM